MVHPIQEWRPALHGDALEDGDAGKNNVVERGDPKIWTLKLNFEIVESKSDNVKRRGKKRDLPFLKANRCGGIADISSGRRVFGGVPVARNNCIRPVAHYFVWKLGFPLGEFGDLLKMNWDQFRGGWNKLGQLRCLNWFLMSFRS